MEWDHPDGIEMPEWIERLAGDFDHKMVMGDEWDGTLYQSMHPELPLSFKVTCPYVPVQLEGHAWEVPFYYRARSGWWCVCVMINGEIDWDNDPSWEGRTWNGGPYDDGTLEEALWHVYETFGKG